MKNYLYLFLFTLSGFTADAQYYHRSGYKSIGYIKETSWSNVTHLQFRKHYVISTDTAILLEISVPFDVYKKDISVTLTLDQANFLKSSLISTIADINKPKELDDYQYDICPNSNLCINIYKKKDQESEWQIAFIFTNELPSHFEYVKFTRLNEIIAYIKQFITETEKPGLDKQ